MSAADDPHRVFKIILYITTYESYRTPLQNIITAQRSLLYSIAHNQKQLATYRALERPNNIKFNFTRMKRSKRAQHRTKISS